MPRQDDCTHTIPKGFPVGLLHMNEALREIDGVGTTPIPIQRGNSDQNSDHGEFEPPEFKSTVNLERKGNSDHGPSFLPGKTQTMVRLVREMFPRLVLATNIRSDTQNP